MPSVLWRGLRSRLSVSSKEAGAPILGVVANFAGALEWLGLAIASAFRRGDATSQCPHMFFAQALRGCF
jgi:hypothetical protein